MNSTQSAIPWLYSFVRPYTSKLLLILCLSLISTFIALAQPYLTKFLIDDGLIGQNFNVLLKFSLLMVAVGLVATVLGGLNRWFYVNVSARILLAMRESVYDHLLSLSPRYYAKTRGGDIIARLDGDVAEIQRFAVDTLLAMVNGIFALTGAVILMLTLSPKLSLLALVLIPLIFGFLKIMRPRVERMSKIVRERSSDITSFFVETLSSVKFIQSAGGEVEEQQNLASLHNRFRQDTLSLQMTNYFTSAIPGLLTSITTAIIFIVGGYLSIQGEMSVGTLIAFSAYLMRATGPVNTILGLYVAWQRAKVSLKRVSEIREAEPEVIQSCSAISLPENASPDIEFKTVSFAYISDEAVLQAVNFKLPAGSKVAVRGPSGVGKTTLVDLLQRHYDPTSGAIYLAGKDLKHLQLKPLRKQIAVVAQDTVLFSTSILDNVRYANPHASDAAIHDAIQRAQIEQFSNKFEQGLQTQVGVRGAALSGGQRQRISIARAILQDPLVLILDEATSGVDRSTEQEIAAAIDELFSDRTRLVISHRPANNDDYDFVLEIHQDASVSLSKA